MFFSLRQYDYFRRNVRRNQYFTLCNLPTDSIEFSTTNRTYFQNFRSLTLSSLVCDSDWTYQQSSNLGTFNWVFIFENWKTWSSFSRRGTNVAVICRTIKSSGKIRRHAPCDRIIMQQKFLIIFNCRLFVLVDHLQQGSTFLSVRFDGR
jgi:hypothetical protein